MKHAESSEEFVQQYQDCFDGCLQNVSLTNREGSSISTGKGLSDLCAISESLQRREGRMFIIGNGASAAFADHMALDWTKNGRVASRSFGDSAWLTAAANDLGVDQVFSAGIELHAREGDMLVAISSSGRSPNIIRAIEQSRSLRMGIVTLTGLTTDNPVRKLGDVNVYIQANTYGMVEVAHQYWLHLWLDRFMGIAEWKRSSPQDMRIDSFNP
ncbi:SIS domain-containing protein [Opitutaceae bacterium]|nr:SIS domain-containing protein [Opitutaceae bacterium]